MRNIVKGTPVSGGTAYAPLVVWHQVRGDLEHSVSANAKEDPRNLWFQAKQGVGRFLENLASKMTSEVGTEQGSIFYAHQMILSDPLLEERVFAGLDGGMSLRSAVQSAVEEIASSFDNLDDPYMKERGNDIRDVGRRIVDYLNESLELSNFPSSPSVIAAGDLLPSEAALMNKEMLRGIILEKGGLTSHTAILARALDIPLVIGIGPAGFSRVAGASAVLVDGDTGTVIVDPSQEALQEYGFSNRAEPGIEFKRVVPEPEVVTRDGVRVEVVANLGSPDELKVYHKYAVAGIGLCRTEFMFLEARMMPSEEEQLEKYRLIVEAAHPHPVTFRTLDIGGDKHLPYLPMRKEENPFLGVRALRLSLAQRELFRTQLRALLRSSAYGSVNIIFPMVATLSEFRQAMEVAGEVRTELLCEGHEVSPDIKWGIMIEIPSAALTAEQFAEEVDFFSIGTNDLIQYTMAADRLNPEVAYLYQPFHPAVLRLISMVIEAAHKKGRKVGMCGEMAGMPEAAPLLLGMGLDEFSMAPVSVPRMRRVLTKLSKKEMSLLAKKALTLESPEQVMTLIKSMGGNEK